MIRSLAIFSTLAFLFCSPAVVFAEGAGLRVNFKSVEIHAEYNDNAGDEILGMDYIRNPDGLLFDLLYLLQSNNKYLKDKNIMLSIDIGNYNRYLYIKQRKPVKNVLIDDTNISHLDKNKLIDAVCKALNITHCRIDRNANIDLFLSNTHLPGEVSDRVLFGCFPCNIDRSITLTNRYTPAKKDPYPPKFKKVTVTRQTIYHYFNKLRE